MKLLDLYCGAGGAAMGYYRAGFDYIVGVDIVRQPRYPFTFILGDALIHPLRLKDFDMIHFSPPCQMYSRTATLPNQRERVEAGQYPDHLPIVRKMARECRVPCVIENVAGTPMRADVVLCGTMFGLRTLRHRWFEIHGYKGERPPLILTPPCNHWGTVKNGDMFSVIGSGSRNRPDKHAIMKYCRKADAQKALGIDWMHRYEMTQAVPPAYTELIGRHMVKYIEHIKHIK